MSKNKYRIPFKKRTLFIAMSDPQVHFGELRHAVDFIIDFDTAVRAAAKGIVADVKQDSKEGGVEKKYAKPKYQNYITINHDNGESSQYIHIAHNSAVVKEGQRVEEGQKIAKGIGIAGLTGGPHLHFMVFDRTKKAHPILSIKWKGWRPRIKTGKKLGKMLVKRKYRKLREAYDKFLIEAKITQEKVDQLMVDLEELREKG